MSRTNGVLRPIHHSPFTIYHSHEKRSTEALLCSSTTLSLVNYLAGVWTLTSIFCVPPPPNNRPLKANRTTSTIITKITRTATTPVLPLPPPSPLSPITRRLLLKRVCLFSRTGDASDCSTRLVYGQCSRPNTVMRVGHALFRKRALPASLCDSFRMPTCPRTTEGTSALSKRAGRKGQKLRETGMNPVSLNRVKAIARGC